MQWARVSPSWSILGPETSEIRDALWSVGLNTASDWMLTSSREHVEDPGVAEDEVHVAPLAGHEALHLALLEDVSDLLGVIPGLGGGGGGKGTV